MGRRLPLSSFCCAVALSLTVTSCGNDGGIDVGKSLVSSVNATINSPFWNAGFTRTVSPWIKNLSDFTQFRVRYAEQRQYSEKEQVDAVIQLGILEYAPQWLTPAMHQSIERYYPGLEKKHASNQPLTVRLAYNDWGMPKSDAPSPFFKMAAVAAPGVLLAAPAGEVAGGEGFAAVIGYIGLSVPGLGEILAAGILTAAGVKAYETAKAKICASSGNSCKPVDTPEVPPDIVAFGDPGDCEQSFHRSLQNDVDSSCKPLPPRCGPRDSCSSVRQRISTFSQCADARKKINNTCYKGGDSGHQTAYTFARQNAATCEGMLASCIN